MLMSMKSIKESYLQEMQRSGAYDEMYDADGKVRPHYRKIAKVLEELQFSEISQRSEQMARSFMDRGVTFDFAGEERPFPIDIIPRIIPKDEWATIESGVKQRVKALELFLDDVYGKQKVLKDGIIPKSLVTSSAHFHRQVWGIRPAGNVRIHVSGIDLIRDNEGTYRVLEDNVRIPSGVSYVIENRQQMMKSLPEALANQSIRRVTAYPRKLYEALKKTAPEGVMNPTVVVLTPGVFNSAYFEHALLAGLMGVELVEGRDLVVRSNNVYMRTTEGEQKVDVIYKRVDDDFIDPLQFRPDSLLGCVGLVNAVRAGNVTIANAIGNGVADDKLLYTYVPDLIRYYLDEEPILPNVDTYRLEDPEDLAYTLEHIRELVVKPVDGSGGKGLVIGSQATDGELERLKAKLNEDPRGWIAQPILQLSTVPIHAKDKFSPRHVDLRPFCVNSGDDMYVLPGGLTRVALTEGSLIVNSSQGGGSKDTWVLGRDTDAPESLDDSKGATLNSMTKRGFESSHLDHGLVGDSGQQQQQQQQQQQEQQQKQEHKQPPRHCVQTTEDSKGDTC